MGCCASGDPQSKIVQEEINKDREKDLGIIKLLLLGSGGSGKSTLFKQLQYIHGDGFTDRQRKQFQSQIHEQLIENMKLLIIKCEEYWDDDPEQNAQYKLYDYDMFYGGDDNSAPDVGSAEEEKNHNTEEDKKVQACAEDLLALRNTHAISQEAIENLRYLWANETIQRMFALRNIICVPDSTAYFFNDLDRVTSDEFTPTDKDLILVRYRTTGMKEKSFNIQGHPFTICDVGGQRNERRKWIHFFNNVTSVIFVVGLSCYDELTFEGETNAMVDSMSVFREYMNNDTFEQMDFILFLNKSDLYHIKIQSVPLTVAECFESYSGTPNDAMEGLEYIKGQFNALNQNEDRSFFQHVTCATDRGQIEKVFNDVQTMIINWSLAKAGLT